MSYPFGPAGPAQEPLDYDRSRITPEIRAALADHSPEIRAGVRAVADAPQTPDKPPRR
jgi:hypothetical protein